MSAATTFASVTTAPSGTGSNITPVLSTHAAGDVLEIWVVNSGVTGWTAPAGWSIKQQQASSGNASTGIIGTLLYRRVLPGDTLPLASPVCNLGATVTRSAVCQTKRNADIEGVHTLPEWLAFGSTTGTSNPVRPPAVVTRSPENLVHVYYGSRSATTAPEQTNYTQVQQVINSGIIVNNVSERTIADQNTSLANQDASPTSGARWIAMISCTPSPDYPYYRSGSQAFSANATNVTPALPAGTSSSDNRGNKDLVVLTAQCAGAIPAVNTPAHWTLISEWSNTTSGGVTTVRKWATLYTGTLDRQVTRPTSGEIFAYLSVYHNAHQSIPLGTSAVQQNASSTTSTFPALPRTGTKATVQATCVADGTQTFTAPAGWTERNDSQGVTCADQSFNATGTTTSASFTLNSASPTLCGLMEVFSVASVINLILTPATAAITTTTFAPKLVLVVTPPAASLTLAAFAPTVTTEASQQFYRSLTIDADLVPNTDQIDFPVLVSFTHDDLRSVSNDGHVASESGFDILFFSDAALTVQLSHELESYDPTTGKVVAHVKLPTVTHSSDTIFYIKYGDASITSSQEDLADTWSNGFEGVWHLGNGVSLGTAKNSVTGGASTISGPVAGGGQIDGGADYTGGAAGDYILTDLGIAQPVNATYEIWSNRNGEGGNGFGRMWVKGSSVDSVMQFYNDAITYTPDEVYIFSAQWDGPSSVGNWSIARPSSGAFHSLAVTYNNSSNANDPLMYLDGAPATVTERVIPSGSLVDSSSENFAIGQRVLTLNRKWDGLLDEFRVSSVIRSADWLATCYNNQSDATAFVTLGVEAEVGDTVVTPSVATLTTTRFAPSLSLRITPTQATLTLASFAPSLTTGTNITPAAANLTTTTFAPAVVQVRRVTPANATLIVSGLAPSLQTSITPASASLTLAVFAPSVTLTVTVPVTSLTLSTFAPVVTVEADVTVTPISAALVITSFAPVLSERVTPASRSLTLTTFAPVLAVVITPATANLSLATSASSLTERTTPTTSTLSLNTFAPTVSVSADIVVQPAVASLSVSRFAPTLKESLTPAAGNLSLSAFAPTVTTSADITVTPTPASLTLGTNAATLRLRVTVPTRPLSVQGFAPVVVTSGATTLIPATVILTITRFAASVIVISPTPPRRTFLVQSEQRTVTVPREFREYKVAEDEREEVLV